VPPAERTRRREELLDLVGLGGLGSRYSHQLSGGQQQRVALARSLAHEPSVLLLDEPFGALDVKIRGQLRRNLREIQRALGVTAILVTHDQEEAFELADRVGLMDRGALLEVGKPEKLYAQPSSLFGATFLGAGTVLVGRARGNEAHLGDLALPIPPEVEHEENARVRVLIRPEQVELSAERPDAGSGALTLGRGTVVEGSFLGALPRSPAPARRRRRPTARRVSWSTWSCPRRRRRPGPRSGWGSAAGTSSRRRGRASWSAGLPMIPRRRSRRSCRVWWRP
jgi:ABC-type Fe3+/spermidine/putrescine transport system ATPase subunit